MDQEENQEQSFGSKPSQTNNNMPIGSGKKSRLSKKAKVFSGIVAFILVFTIGFGGFSIYQNIQSNAGGEDILGDPSILAEAGQGLVTPEQTPIFNLMYGGMQFNTGYQDGYSATYPYPVSGGVYRITRSKTPTITGSWVQIKPETTMLYVTDESSTTGKGWFVEGTTCSGDGNKGSCDSPEQDGERLPGDAMPGDKYYYRTEIKGVDGTWTSASDDVVSYTVPKPSVSFTDPTYGEIDRWDNRYNAQNIAENPLAIVKWSGSGDINNNLESGSCPVCTLYESDSADMSNKLIRYIRPTGQESPGLAFQDASVSVQQAPGSTSYYAIYKYVGPGNGDGGDSYTRISDVTPYTTPLLKNAPKLDIRMNTETVDQYNNVSSTFTFGGDLDGVSSFSNSHSPFTMSVGNDEYIVERSTNPDATYKAGDPKTKQWTSTSYLITDKFDSKPRENMTYYYRVRPANGNWTHSDKTWSQIIKADPPSDTNATYYQAPILNISSVAHDTIIYSLAAGNTDPRGIELDVGRDKAFTTHSLVKVGPSINAAYTNLSPNKTYYLRLSYYPSNFAKIRQYTPVIQIKTLTDPYDAKLLQCSFKAPASIVRGNKMTLSVTIKNTGTNTFTGTARPFQKFTPQLNFSFGDRHGWEMFKTLNVGSIKPGAVKTITHTFTVPKKASKGKQQASVWASNYISPCDNLNLTKKVEIK